MLSAIVSRIIILVFGTLYPAYASYKAVRTKNIKEYVKWMMYWIVFALFSTIEAFTDIFLAWFPFYYEVKVCLVLWLLSPITKGSSTLYRKFVHPTLTRREQDIDEYITQCKEKGYTTVLQLGSKGVNYATNVIMQTAIKTFQTIPQSQSDNAIASRTTDTTDYPTTNQRMPRSHSANDAYNQPFNIGSSPVEDEFYPAEYGGDPLAQYPSYHDIITEEDELMLAEEMLLESTSARIREVKPRRGRPKKSLTDAPKATARPKRQLRGNSMDVDVVNG